MTRAEVSRLGEIAAGVPSWAAIVEIGTHTGLSTCWMAAAGPAHVTAIDPYPPAREGSSDDPFAFGDPEGAMREFHGNLTRLGLWHKVTPLRARSTDVAPYWVQPVGLLFIDAVHERDPLAADYEAWERFVPVGGWLALHDFNEVGYPGVPEAVREVILPSGRWEPAPLVESLWTARRVA